MSKLLIDSTTLTNIADAIRNKIDSVDLYSPAEMAAKIWEIQNSNNFKLGQKIITENGIYNSSEEINNPLDGYSQVIVSVLNTYAARDEGKVIQNGVLVPQTTLSIDRNGTYDTTIKNSVEVQVPSASANLGTKTIEENGTYRALDDNYDGYYSIDVNVPVRSEISLGTKTFLMRGEYQAADDNLDGYSTVIVDTTNSYLEEENHQVVVGQRLFPQTSTYITENGTYDTTLNNETTVNVQPPLQNKTITENGIFAADTGYYGLNTVVINLPNVYYINDIDKVVISNGLSTQTSRTITSNGNYNTTFNNNLVISVPNTYSAADNGKVVYNQALSTQTSRTITTNGTYLTSTNNQVIVSVPSDLDLIEGNITYSNLNRSYITTIRMHTFRELSVFTNISLPNCLNIGDYAFYRCSNISMVSMPNCSYIGSYAFYSCSKISVVSMPNCSHISNYAFAYCYKLPTISLSKC